MAELIKIIIIIITIIVLNIGLFYLGTMVELQGVNDILGGLGDDDDELLAEMGADFNILEYADPELEALTGGKTNILDLELEEEPMKKDNKVATAPTTLTATSTITTTGKLKNNYQGIVKKKYYHFD